MYYRYLRHPVPYSLLKCSCKTKCAPLENNFLRNSKYHHRCVPRDGGIVFTIIRETIENQRCKNSRDNRKFVLKCCQSGILWIKWDNSGVCCSATVVVSQFFNRSRAPATSIENFLNFGVINVTKFLCLWRCFGAWNSLKTCVSIRTRHDQSPNRSEIDQWVWEWKYVIFT